ncbi:MAG: thiamine pyrophosphate-binding protein [Candidatus Promineifilaceae bacterium]
MAVPMITGAKFIAETFKGYGVSHVFFMDAILRKTMVEFEKLGIHRIITHSEKAAVYMADGYARASHKPGICMCQSVGAANLAAGLQDPYLGRSPVIALTGKKPPLFQNRNAYQEIIHGPLYDPVTKYNVDVTLPSQLPYYLRQAFREATTGTPRPVHLDLLGHSARNVEAAEEPFPIVIEETYSHYPADRPEPDNESIQKAAKAIRAAQQPVIVAGGGVRLSSAQAEVVALAEKLNIPVANSVNGKGTIPDNHRLSVGPVGTYSVRCANQVVHEADLVIFIGSNTGDQVTNNWRIPAAGTPIVQIDINSAEIGRNYPNVIGVVGDARTAVSRLTEALDAQPGNESWLQRVAELVSEWRQLIEPLRNSDERPIRPERLCKELTEVLPDNAVLVADTGYSAIWTATQVYLNHPEQIYIRAAGSLGWSFPAALGAKCALPDRPVICFNGDGAFWYHLSELETARRHNINTVTIINNNGGFGQGIKDIHTMYGDNEGNKEELYAFSPVNLANIAQEMGCWGRRVEDPADIQDAVREALGAGKPAVVEVLTGLHHRAIEAWSP